jgi:uncharacterized RDD family membrane protein YckC
VTEPFNPYQPPKAVVLDEPTPEAEEIEPAHKGRRFGTYVVDLICMLVMVFFLSLAAVVLFGEAAVEWIESLPDIVFGVIVTLIYYLFFEGIWARTPGKWLFRTKVVSNYGLPPTFRAVLLRTVSRLIPFEPFSVLFGERGWHDGIADTYVVPAKR